MDAQDLTTLPTLKAWLPINSTQTADDATLARLLTAVSMDFERAIKRLDLLLASYTEVHQGDGSSRMIAFHWPVIAITSLVIGAQAITVSADKIANGYYLDEDIDPERIWNIYLNGYAFTDRQPVKIAYSAGYVQPGATPATGQIALPEDIEQAVLDWCAYRYKERPNVATTQRRSTEGETASTVLLDAPPNVLSVIQRYTRTLPSLDRRAEEREERIQRGSSTAKPARRK